MGAKVLMVAWDSAERDLVDRWASDGRLPMLAGLRSSGLEREVASPNAFGDDAAWASFCTGTELRVHSRCHWQRIAPDGHRLRYARRGEMSPAPFWDDLARSGTRIAVIDVPSNVGEPAGSLIVGDWLAHAIERPEPFVTWPQLESRLTRDPRFVCDELGRDADATQAFDRALSMRAALRGDVLVDVLADDDWDLFLAVCAEPHCVGHQCWHDHDATHPEHDPARRRECGDPVERTYVAADAQLARLVDAAGPGATVIVFSLLGMGTNHSGEHLLDEMLLRIDGTRASPSIMTRAYRVGRRITPTAVLERTPIRVRQAHRDAVTRDRARRSAWTLPTDLPTTAVRIGVVGRDDGGTVEPGAPLAAQASRLADEVRALSDPETDTRVVDDVVDVRAVHGARAADEFADLMVVWSQDGPITALRSPRYGTVRGTPPPARTGNHRSRGWVVAAGPGVETGEWPARVAAHDFAGLVARLLEHAPPRP